MHCCTKFLAPYLLNIKHQMSEKDDNETNDQTINENDHLAKELKTNLKISVNETPPDIGPTPYKVAIVGMNELGSATAFLLICRQVVTDVIIIDRNAKRLAGRNFENPDKLFISILAEYADLSTCTTFVSGVNVQASNQLASCEGARVVIMCDVNDIEEEKVASSITQSSSQHNKILSNFKSISRDVGVHGMCKGII